MRILGIESSCDETAIAVVSDSDSRPPSSLPTHTLPSGRGGITHKGGGITVEKNFLATQIDIHKQYGGVVPEIAAREHVSAIAPMLIESGIPRDGEGIDAIAVTYGPGLVPALRIGVELAKTLAWVWKKPLVAVNHLEGHVYSVWGGNGKSHGVMSARGGSAFGGESRSEGRKTVFGFFTKNKMHQPSLHNFTTPRLPVFPALCLLVSGGHTELFLMHDHGKYEMIGMTRDDATGEAFDKVAKLLELGYPGGPAISKIALEGNPNAIAFPRPMLESGDFNFSFSGLKTAVRVYLETSLRPPSDSPLVKGGGSMEWEGASIADVAASFQQAVIEVLTIKTLAAVQRFAPKSVILSGGVSANHALRELLSSELGNQFPEVTFHAPDLSLSGDNAVMIAIAGLYRAKKSAEGGSASGGKDFVDPLTLEAQPNLRLV